MNIICEECGYTFKSRVSVSHLLSAHNMSMLDYRTKYPNTNYGKWKSNDLEYTCKICDININTSHHLSQHVRRHHNLLLGEYYTRYYLDNILPMCKCGCGNYTTFKNMKIGFNDFLPSHGQIIPNFNNSDILSTSEVIQLQQTHSIHRITKILKCNFKATYDFINTKYKNTLTDIFSEKVYRYINNIDDIPKCKYCNVGNVTAFRSITDGYRKYCSHSCMMNDSHPKFKVYTLPSGTSIKLQGYEPFAMDYLLTVFHETDIVTQRHEIPTFKYSIHGVDHIYYADFLIKSTNTIIEVKSTWTDRLEIEINELKKKSVITNGYNFVKLIFDSKRNLMIK